MSAASAGSLPHRPQSLRAHQGVVRFSGAYKFWAHRRRFQAALQVSLNRSSGGLTISAGTDWSKVHMHQYVHELGTRAHRHGSQRSTERPNVTLEVKVVRSVNSGLWNHWDGLQDFFATPPSHKKWKGRVLSPYLNCNSESVHRKWRGMFFGPSGTQPSVQCDGRPKEC